MEITIFEDMLAPDGTLCVNRYVAFFMKNIQPKITEPDGKTHLEGGLACYSFLKNLTLEAFKSPIFYKWAKDDTLNTLHKKIKAKGMQLDPINFYVLSLYILTYIREQYYVLLKPTVKDTIEELVDVASVTFTNKDGKETTTTNSQFIKMLLGNLVDEDSEEYEVLEVVRMEEYTDKSNLQSSFCYYMARFLQEYFKDYPRRANCCMVSALEQELILYMIYFFQLSAVPLTSSRFRQLIGKFGKFKERVELSILPEIGMVPVEFVKYKDWKNGNINFDKIDEIKEGDRVKF